VTTQETITELLREQVSLTEPLHIIELVYLTILVLSLVTTQETLQVTMQETIRQTILE